MLVAPAGVGLAGALAAAAKVIIYPTYHDRNQLNVSITVSFERFAIECLG